MGGKLSTSSTGLVTWGEGVVGQLGQRTNTKAKDPALVTPLDYTEVASLVCGSKNACYMYTSGHMAVWGCGEAGQLAYQKANVNVPTELKWSFAKAVQISMADNFTAVVCEDGTLYTWGSGRYGCLGINSETDMMTPSLVNHFQDAGIRVAQVSAGSTSCACVTEHGQVYVWGFSQNGQLGLGTMSHSKSTGFNQRTPTVVESLAGTSIAKVSVGDTHTIAMGSDGSLYAWGKGDAGQTGLRDKSQRWKPDQIKVTQRFVDVIASVYHSVGLTSDGEVMTWGHGRFGCLGLGSEIEASSPKLIEALKGKKVVSIGASKHRTTFILADGTPLFCGGNAKHPHNVPTAPKLPKGMTAAYFDSGDDFLALIIGKPGPSPVLGAPNRFHAGGGGAAATPTPAPAPAPAPAPEKAKETAAVDNFDKEDQAKAKEEEAAAAAKAKAAADAAEAESAAAAAKAKEEEEAAAKAKAAADAAEAESAAAAAKAKEEEEAAAKAKAAADAAEAESAAAAAKAKEEEEAAAKANAAAAVEAAPAPAPAEDEDDDLL